MGLLHGVPTKGCGAGAGGAGAEPETEMGWGPNWGFGASGTVSWKACTWHYEGMAPQPAPLGMATRWMMALYFCPQAPGPGTCLTQCPGPGPQGGNRQLLQMFPLLRPGNVLSHMLPAILPPRGLGQLLSSDPSPRSRAGGALARGWSMGRAGVRGRLHP